MMYISELAVAVEPAAVPVAAFTVSEVGATVPLPVLSEATA